MYEFIYEEAGKRIRLLREERNLSRDILSERAEISAKFLYEIESGKKGFSADTLYRLSKALNVPSEYILSGNCSINDISEYIPKAKLFSIEQEMYLQAIIQLIYKLCCSYDSGKSVKD